jgi:hypothetical protein
MSERGAVGGDVMRDELPEERPDGGGRRVRALLVGEFGPDIAQASWRAQQVQISGGDRERREILEQVTVASAVDRRVDAFRGQAMVSGDADRVDVLGHALAPSVADGRRAVRPESAKNPAAAA